jgi:hypothetical protein
MIHVKPSVLVFLASSIGFGLGSAWTGFGLHAGILFWVVMFLIAIVKVAITETYYSLKNNRDEWKKIFAVKPDRSLSGNATLHHSARKAKEI